MSEFKVKFALQKRSKTSPKSIMALQNMKKWTKKIIWHFGICPKQCTTDRSTSLVCVQLKKRGFEKNSLTKVMEIFNSYYAENSFRGMCTRWVSVMEFHDWALGIGKVFGQESTVVKWNYQILSPHLVTVCQKVPILDFQSDFSMSKIIRIFLKKSSLKNINLGAPFL